MSDTLSADDSAQALRDAVALQVMGWTLAERQWAYSDMAEVWHTPDGMPLLTRFAWRPDESDAQSAQVLDRMRALGFDYVLREDAQGASVTFSHGERDGERSRTDPCRRQAVLSCAVAMFDTSAAT